METGDRCIFLKPLLAALLVVIVIMSIAPAQAADPGETDDLFMPQILRVDVQPEDIAAENFEIGVHFGKHSVEDFGVNNLIGLSLAYHISEDFFLEFRFGDSDLQQPVGANFANRALDFTYYDLSVGWNIFPGESFVLRDRVFNSQIYLIAGVGAANHVENKESGMLVFGSGYRLIISEQLALHADVRDHVFKPEVLEKNLTHNFELSVGISYFF